MNIKDKLNRTINSLRRKKVYSTYNYNNGTNFYRKQINRVVICIIIVLALLIIKKVNVKFTNNIIRIVDESINYSFDIREDTKKAYDFFRDIVKIPDKVIETFSTDVFKW